MDYSIIVEKTGKKFEQQGNCIKILEAFADKAKTLSYLKSIGASIFKKQNQAPLIWAYYYVGENKMLLPYRHKFDLNEPHQSPYFLFDNSCQTINKKF